ncbi:MAG TPA: UDP-N-acetylmuramoyl-L-alanyl-D-glutamate--2,6-diaminopimelate ligase [Acetobacteraceae bacterium]|nr:UDP-N-acetylmuramoyl-L-alanyl-D-glutamate--2,6-diaminopimelate ligase [Acetobacteraceae bacterium]
MREAVPAALRPSAIPAAATGLPIAGLTADSRLVQPGFLFAALPGARADGRAFIAEAVERGAAAVLAPPGTAWPPGVPPRPLIEDAEPRRLLARLAAVHAGVQPETVVAVTGTNGKTSTVEFLRQIWALGGAAAASLGTLGVIAPGQAGGEGLTTPDPVALAATMAALARAGIRRAAIEASSHGLDQFRLDGLRLAAAGFSNLTRDHLDYHGTIEAYRAAKLRLFEELLPAGAAVVASAAMDPVTLAALGAIAERRRLALATVGEGGDMLRLLHARATPDGQVLRVVFRGARREIRLPLPGRFQADNALLAAGLAMALGEAETLDRLPHLAGVRGRMELAARLPNGAAAYVDYAHTPDALERLLAALRPHAAGKLVVVFGAGGDRDPGKRPLMGSAVARHADRAIVTDDNPRSEDPAAIRAAILAAMGGMATPPLEIGDRAAAIAAGLELLGPSDVLAVAGKGHEQGQTVGGTVLPFDDAATIRRLAGAA